MNIGSWFILLYLQFVTEIIGVRFKLNKYNNITKGTTQMFKPHLRIVAGREAKKTAFPYQIAFTLRNSGLQNAYIPFCGGALIAMDKILSAAHCFESLDTLYTQEPVYWINEKGLEGVLARAGSIRTVGWPKKDSLETGQYRKLYNCRIPTSYNFPKDDIAVLLTFSQFVITPYVNRIRYARYFSDYIGPCYASGFGKVSWASRAAQPEMLMFAEMDVLTDAECTNMEEELGYLKVVCARRRKDIGAGDSGGPLVCFNSGIQAPKLPLLVGITSGKSTRTNSPFFTRVSAYLKLIETPPEYDPDTGHRIEAKYWICILMTVLSLIHLYLS